MDTVVLTRGSQYRMHGSVAVGIVYSMILGGYEVGTFSSVNRNGTQCLFLLFGPLERRVGRL